MKLSIIVNIIISGIHQWKQCHIKEVDYLKYPHRHQFYIKCEKTVSSTEREIEIIMFKKRIIDFFESSFNKNKDGSFYLENMSCESIGIMLVNEFDLESCEVLEDGENGAKILK